MNELAGVIVVESRWFLSPIPRTGVHVQSKEKFVVVFNSFHVRNYQWQHYEATWENIRYERGLIMKKKSRNFVLSTRIVT